MIRSAAFEAGASRDARFAMRLSLGFGAGMLAVKWAAYLLTGSAAILSDAVESLVHIAAVAFAAFSMELSQRPANPRFLYGYERVSFFSAGFEGGMIMLAGGAIIFVVIQKWLAGLQIENLGYGLWFTFGVAVVNAVLGLYLLRTGRKSRSLILEANGKHILTDSWTSFGVVGGLALVIFTGWKPFDPLLAIAVALNILVTGGNLVVRSIRGLMDSTDEETGLLLRQKLDRIGQELGIEYHHVRYRSTGHRLLVDLHLLFPDQTPIGEAHRRATLFEARLLESLDQPAEVLTHLEPHDDHPRVHPGEPLSD